MHKTLFCLCIALSLALASDRPTHAADPAKPTGTIKGTVKFTGGAAAANVKVEIFESKGNAAANQHTLLIVLAHPLADKPVKNPPPVAKTTTDANGKFTLDKVPVGKYRLNAGDLIGGFSFAQITVEANKTTTQDLTIKKRRKPGL
jgi:hypothetical protein